MRSRHLVIIHFFPSTYCIFLFHISINTFQTLFITSLIISLFHIYIYIFIIIYFNNYFLNFCFINYNSMKKNQDFLKDDGNVIFREAVVKCMLRIT